MQVMSTTESQEPHGLLSGLAEVGTLLNHAQEHRRVHCSQINERVIETLSKIKEQCKNMRVYAHWCLVSHGMHDISICWEQEFICVLVYLVYHDSVISPHVNSHVYILLWLYICATRCTSRWRNCYNVGVLRYLIFAIFQAKVGERDKLYDKRANKVKQLDSTARKRDFATSKNVSCSHCRNAIHFGPKDGGARLLFTCGHTSIDTCIIFVVWGTLVCCLLFSTIRLFRDCLSLKTTPNSWLLLGCHSGDELYQKGHCVPRIIKGQNVPVCKFGRQFIIANSVLTCVIGHMGEGIFNTCTSLNEKHRT